MRMLSGAVLILAAAVLFAARWVGKVMQYPAVVGSNEAGFLTLAVAVLGIAGVVLLIVGAVADRTPRD